MGELPWLARSGILLYLLVSCCSSLPDNGSHGNHGHDDVIMQYHDLRELVGHLEQKLDKVTSEMESKVDTVKTEIMAELLEQRLSILDLVSSKLDLFSAENRESRQEFKSEFITKFVASIDEKLSKQEMSRAVRLNRMAINLKKEILLLRNANAKIPNENLPSPIQKNLTSDVTRIETINDVITASCANPTSDAAARVMTSFVTDRVTTALRAYVTNITGYPDNVCHGANISVTYDPDDLDLSRPHQAFQEPRNCEDGWLVFLRRQDGSENFTRGWEDYAAGFGDLTAEFWLGNRKLHNLTSGRRYRLKVELKDVSGEVKVAEYDRFSVGPEDDNFRLRVGNLVVGQESAGNSLGGHNNMGFSTPDRDNDARNGTNCAGVYKAGWWYMYNSCHATNPTGLYLPPGRVSTHGVTWYTAYGEHRSLSGLTMKIRPFV